MPQVETPTGGKSIGRMTDDVGMHAFGQMKPKAKSARTRVGVVIGYQRNAGRVGEACRYRRGFPMDVRRTCERSCAGRRRKRSLQHDALGMDWSKARVKSEDGVELLNEILTERYNPLVRR
jgi:hypothetical protein